MQQREYKNVLIWLTVFSVAMALLESAVVVYLRALYYPDGFTVALKLIDQKILLTEFLREIATVVMLLSIASIVAKNRIQAFAYFLFSFAIWDIFYYVWLKVLIDWPSSILEWDILFLIPVTWLGPVLAPVLCSLTMILLALALLTAQRPKIELKEWTLLILGSCLILFTFMKDYSMIMFKNDLWSSYSTLMENEAFLNIASSYTPISYDWIIFGMGEVLLLFTTYLVFKRGTNISTYLISTQNQ